MPHRLEGPLNYDSGREVCDDIVQAILEFENAETTTTGVTEEGIIEDTPKPAPVRTVYELDKPVDNHNQSRAQWEFKEGMKVFVFLRMPSPITDAYLVSRDKGECTIPYALLAKGSTPQGTAQRLLTNLVGFTLGESSCAYVPSIDAYAVAFSLYNTPELEERTDLKWVAEHDFRKLAKKLSLEPDTDNVEEEQAYTSFNQASLSKACDMLQDPNFPVAYLMQSVLNNAHGTSTSASFEGSELRDRAYREVCTYLGRQPISDGELRDACSELLKDSTRGM